MVLGGCFANPSVVTDGFAAFDKIHSSVVLLIAGSKLGFSFSWDGQSTLQWDCLSLLGVTLCLPHGPGTTSHSPPKQPPAVISCTAGTAGAALARNMTDKTGELIYAEPHLGR